MSRIAWILFASALVALGPGCASLPKRAGPEGSTDKGACKSPEEASEQIIEGPDSRCMVCKKKEEPPTLFEWALCKEEEGEEKDEEKGEEKDEGPKANGMKGDEVAKAKDNGKENGTKESNGDKQEKTRAPVCWYRESRAEHRANIKREPLESDRPDFTEASSTVGRGIIQLEAGYTYFRDRDIVGARTSQHSFPEMLFRIGMFADWFELRLGQNFANQRTRASAAELEVVDSFGGAEDLYLGVKLALTEQKDFLPEMALILQTDVPTGSDEFTAKQLLPGVNWLYGWDIIQDCLSLGGSTQANRANDDLEHFYVEFAQSLTVGYRLTPAVGAYTEWFCILPTGSIDPLVGPQYYFDGGFTYLVCNDLQLDIRAGVGLNRHATDFFAGAGFVIRY